MSRPVATRMHRSHRVLGALVGSAVGDALGAPFELGPPGQFSARFPVPARGARTEMCGGGPNGREPGEFTDDTQLALLLGTSLVERGGLDEADVSARFVRWAAAEHEAPTSGAAGNGSLVRATPAAIRFSLAGTAATTDAARRISALTHGPAAGEGCAVFAELVRVALDGGDPLAAVPAALDLVAPEHRARWAAALAPDWTPALADGSSGAVEPTLGSALWALRRGADFAAVLRLVVDLGGNTVTVACVTGALAGAVFGMAGIPARWSSAVHGRVPGCGERVWRLPDLQELAAALDGRPLLPHEDGAIPTLGPVEVLPGIWAANLAGARAAGGDFAVVSLCRVGEPFGAEVQRLAYLADNENNTELDAVLADVLDDVAALRAEGRRVLVHCHGGASRTGLVLRAWLRRTEGLSAEEATAVVRERWPHLDTWNGSFTAALERIRPDGD